LGGCKREDNDKEETVGVVTLGVCSADERWGSKSKGDGYKTRKEEKELINWKKLKLEAEISQVIVRKMNMKRRKGRRQILLRSKDKNEVDKEYEESSRRFKEIMEKGRKREERLKAESIAEKNK
jgi:hypothetical protein